LPGDIKRPDRGWHLRMARSVSKSHYYVNGRSLCGRQSVGSNAVLSDDMHHSGFNCAVCMKKRDKMFGENG
jgi:hypothetical protein